MIKKIDGIMYTKFNNHDKKSTMVISNKKGIAVVDHTFSNIPKEEQKIKQYTQNTPNTPMDEIFIWGAAFNKKKRGL